MRQEQGLDTLIQHQAGLLSAKVLSGLLLDDLQACCCRIYGATPDEVPVLLAELSIIPESLYYDTFAQQIDFAVSGDILNDQYVPLTYKVQGLIYSFHGRCSVIPKVCGIDLYLNKSYTGKQGDHVRQNFSISVKKLLKTIAQQKNK